MSVPPVKYDPVKLAARVAKAMNLAHRLAYAQLSSELKFVQLSNNFTKLLNCREQNLANRPVTDLLWEFIGAETTLQNILLGERPHFRLEHVNREQVDGSVAYLNFQVTPLDEAQPGQGLLLLVEDETEYGNLRQNLVQDRNELRLLQQQLLQTNEALQTLNRLKSLFLSISAHDLRTPLTAIGGYASLMLDRLPAGEMEDIRQYLTIVLSQSDRMNRLISDFLDLDQIEEGRLTIKPETCDLNEIIQEVMAVMQFNIDSRQLDVVINLPPVPLQLWADREKIYRVIYNLVSNAVKYTQRRGRIQVRSRQSEDQIIMQVLDNGLGMTEEQVGKLFQLYYRTEGARRSKTEGTGLGLYIVRMLVEAHQGRVEAASQPGNGTVFTVYLPSL